MSLVRTFGCRHVIIGVVGALLVTNSFAFAGQKKSPLHKSSKKFAPVPVQEKNRIQVVKFDPGDICVSVEGPNIDQGQDTPDPFSDCARAIYRRQLATFGFPKGTQKNAAAAGLLTACLKQKPGSETLLIGHGLPGMISTGNGQFPPRKGQALVAGVPESAAGFEGLDTPRLTLFGCWSGATPTGRSSNALVNIVASQSRRVRAQNSVVFCSLEKNRQGLYLDASKDLVWAHDTLDGSTLPESILQLKKDILDKPACICLKDQDDMCGESVDLKLNVDNAKFPLDEAHLTAYTPPVEPTNFSAPQSEPVPDFQRLKLLRANTENLVDQIGFCSPGQPGAPDLAVTGSFTLSIHGKPRQFDVLGDAMVQDHDHPEQLYWMRYGAFQQFHESFQQQWEMLQQQLKLRSLRKAHTLN